MSFTVIGNDVAILVLGPAAFTGIAALKARYIRIPFAGHYLPVASRWRYIGPMTHNVHDVAWGYSLLSVPDGYNRYAVDARNAELCDGKHNISGFFRSCQGLAGPIRLGCLQKLSIG